MTVRVEAPGRLVSRVFGPAQRYRSQSTAIFMEWCRGVRVAEQVPCAGGPKVEPIIGGHALLPRCPVREAGPRLSF